MKYDLGCGERTSSEWVGIDIVPGEEVDVVHDLKKGVPFDHDLVGRGRVTR